LRTSDFALQTSHFKLRFSAASGGPCFLSAEGHVKKSARASAFRRTCLVRAEAGHHVRCDFFTRFSSRTRSGPPEGGPYVRFLPRSAAGASHYTSSSSA